MDDAVIYRLQKTRDYRSDKDRKFFLDVCNKRIVDNPVIRTDDWLFIKDALLDNKVMQAIMDKNKPVVIKLGEQERIFKEFNTTRMLYEARVQGFVKYICAFSCVDDLTNLTDRGFCNGKGSMQHALIMPYFKHGSIKTYAWTLENFHVLKSLVKETITCGMILAQQYSIIHNDLHADNIMMVSSSKTNKRFDDLGIGIPRFGYKPIMIDLELHHVVGEEQNIAKVFCGDLRKLFFSLGDLKKATIELLGLPDILNVIESLRDPFNQCDWAAVERVFDMVDNLTCRVG